MDLWTDEEWRERDLVSEDALQLLRDAELPATVLYFENGKPKFDVPISDDKWLWVQQTLLDSSSQATESPSDDAAPSNSTKKGKRKK